VYTQDGEGASGPSRVDPMEAESILAVDCGSTTSKARFFRKVRGGWRYICSGEAPTTVEAPFENVLHGIRNAVGEVEKRTERTLLGEDRVVTPSIGDVGVDLFLCTSSAGGGLQMVVTGLAGRITAESAERAALGAGALVMDVLAVDDDRTPYERIDRIRLLRPDIVLITGGVDGGAVRQLEDITRQVKASDPRPRQGLGFRMPIIYAGNRDCRASIEGILGNSFDFVAVDNLRPVLEVERLEPAREAIRGVFLEHVMAHAPGYDELMRWTSAPIIPTPAGEGMMFRRVAEKFRENVLGVGLGGATTNVYSIYDGRYLATLSANLGMSYSIYNVLREVGASSIMRWLPFKVEENILCNSIHNKAVHPTTIPQTLEDLLMEHAVAREAIRLGLQAHMELTNPLRGAVSETGLIGSGFRASEAPESYIDMKGVDWICGTGGLLSHAPRMAQSALILIDSFQPEGVTKLALDSVFMMPHLGVLSTVHPDAALEVFERDCLIRLGTCVTFGGSIKEEWEAGKVEGELPGGKSFDVDIQGGAMMRIPLRPGDRAMLKIEPRRGLDVGRGPGRRLEVVVEGGAVGIIIDARGRPLVPPGDGTERIERLLNWLQALEAYPQGCHEGSGDIGIRPGGAE